MTHSCDELRELLDQCAELPYGPGQVAQVEEVVRRADALAERRLMFEARMLATEAYTFGGEPAKAFVTFSWCLAEFDGTPGGFTAWDDEQLRWHYKWIISALRDFPEIPLERTAALLDDMERRYRLGGHSMHAVYALRWRLARHVGDAAAADRWYALWCAAPRDENSDCEGCDPTSKVEHLVERGRDAEALAMAEPVLAGRLSCHQQPHSMLTELMLPYLRTGQLERAREAHLRGYRGFRDRLADMFEVAAHIEFCGLTGNEARGLELIERHLDWLDRAPSPRASMQFATACAVVLRRLAMAGRGRLTVYRRAAPGRAAGEVAVAALADELTELAGSLAARFDARNGTTHCTGDVARRLAAPPVVGYLPLSAVARAGARLAAPPGADAQPGSAAQAGATPAQTRRRSAHAAALARLPEDITPEQLLDRADHAHDVLDDEDLAVALWAAFADRFAESTLAEATRARALEATGRVAVLRDWDHAVAEKPFTAAIELYRSCGDEVAARIAETWLGRSLSRNGDHDRGIALIEQAVAWLREHGPATVLTRCELRLAEALNPLGRIDESLAAVDRAGGTAASDPSPTIGLRIDLMRAFCLLPSGRFAEAAELSQRVRDAAQEAARPEIAGLASACLGYAREGSGEAAAAVDAYDVALRTTTEQRLIDQIRAARAHLLAASPRAAEVVDELVEVVAALVARGEGIAAAVAQFDLAVAYHAAGELLDAAETAETAVRALGAVGRHAAADRCRYRLSRIYTDLGEVDQALVVLDELVGRLDGYDNLPVRGQVHEDAARLLFRADRDAVAAARFAAAEECFRAAGRMHDAARVLRARAVALSWADDPAAGVEALAEADRLAAQLPAQEPATRYELAMLDVDAARVLANADRVSDAVERLAAASARLRDVDAYSEALDAELLHARLLLGLGRLAQGEAMLRSVIAASPHDTGVHRSAVWTLIAVLDETGRRVDASALRAAYDLPDYADDEADGEVLEIDGLAVDGIVVDGGSGEGFDLGEVAVTLDDEGDDPAAGDERGDAAGDDPGDTAGDDPGDAAGDGRGDDPGGAPRDGGDGRPA